MSMLQSWKAKVSRAAKDASMQKLFPATYAKYAKAPVNPRKVIFLEMRMPKLSNNFYPLYDILKKNYDLEVHCHYLQYAFKSGKAYLDGCLAFIRDAADASVIFVNDACNVIGAIPIRKETTVIQLWHACGAFKKWGMSTVDLKFGSTLAETKKHPYYKNLDYVTVSSPEVCWAYAEAMDLQETPEKVVPVGVGRTDVFFAPDVIAKAQQALYRAIPAAKQKKILLYAPTFRGNPNQAIQPNQLDIPAIQKLLGDSYLLLIKHHPFIQEKHPIPAACREFAYDVSQLLSIEQLLCVSDACISDYSSLIFEYALFEKPMLFFAYDLDEYFDWRGFYYDYDTLTPGPVCKTNAQLLEQLKHLDSFDMAKVRAFRETFMSACDGHACERILDLAFGKRLQQYRKK